MKPVDIRTSWYFPGSFRIAGTSFVAFGVLIAFVNIYIGVALAIAGILIVTTQYRLAIDFNNRVYDEYVWVLGVRSGEKTRFEKVDYIFIKENHTRQTMTFRVAQTSFVLEIYHGYLKFSDTDKIHLASDASKPALVNRMRRIAQQVNCDVIDYTGEVAIQIWAKADRK